ncbi:MAG TPA: glycosyltransferase [Mycobacteriales bacterium]|nr:glycosyltransferase [Mycobacteriales bacterium]
MAPWVPSLPSPHAGGEHVYRHLEALAGHHDVTLLAPSSDPTVAAPPGVETVIIPFRPAAGPVQRVGDYLRWLLAGVGWEPRAETAARRSLAEGRHDRVLAGAHVVEAQYVESLRLAQRVAERAAAPVVLWSHDIVTAELRRQVRAADSFRRRAEGIARMPGAWAAERRRVRHVRGIVVFNPRESVRWRQRLDVEVKVVSPASAAAITEPVSELGTNALLVGSFRRPANREGLDWLAHRVWPLVRARVPTARLLLVGSGAPQLTDEGVETVGFVPDLAPYYGRARVAVVPIFAGAGLKFRVAQALASGVPVVATHNAADGYAAPAGSGFAAVTDSPVEFADAVVRMLTSPDEAAGIGRRGLRWWQDYVSQTSSEHELAQWYESLADGKQV